MSKTFREWTLDQALLLPPSVHDFVPAGHLSRFVVALVTEELDLSTIMASYKGEKGQPPYHPAMMVALLLYGYAVGLYSSRRLAKGCMERVFHGNRGAASARLSHHLGVPTPPSCCALGAVRAGAQTVRAGRTGEARARGARRHQDQGECVQAQGDELRAHVQAGGRVASRG